LASGELETLALTCRGNWLWQNWITACVSEAEELTAGQKSEETFARRTQLSFQCASPGSRLYHGSGFMLPGWNRIAEFRSLREGQPVRPLLTTA
jgi:hypothetical protein